MIKVHTDDLPREKEAKIRQWLTKPEAAEFLDIVSGKAKEHMAQAMNDAFQASDTNSKIDAANSHLAMAQQYEKFCEIFVRFAADSKPLKSVRLS